MPYSLRTMVRKTRRRHRRIVVRPLRPRPADVQGLYAIYRRVAEIWEAGLDDILRVYRVQPGIVDSADDVSRTVDIIAAQVASMLAQVPVRLRNWSEGVERRHRQQWREGVLAATGIDVDTVLSPVAVTETVGAAVTYNASLIKTVSAETQGKISEIVLRGVQQRTPAAKVAADIRAQTEITGRRALNIASDQSTKLYSALDQARQEEAGLDHFIWQHSRKKNPREIHVARDGKLYKWREGVTGPGLPPPEDKPGYLPYCACTARAVILGDDGEPL